MDIGFRWYGEGNDNVQLENIRQIPGTTQIVWALHHKAAGEVWEKEEIQREIQLIESHGFKAEVVESVNVHEDIKLGLPSREEYIAKYIETIKNLGGAGVKVICYNFMPVFDWIRTDLAKEMPDGSTALFYEKDLLNDASPQDIIERVLQNPEFTMPGWEPERLSKIEDTIQQYESVSEDDLFSNLQYFLERVIPVCKEHDVRLAIHPDDPPWSVFNLPRIVSNQGQLQRILSLVDEEHNGLTLCSGALGANKENDVPAMIHAFQNRIHFAHVRNVYRYDNGDFIESSHREEDGSVPITDIMNAYYDIGYKGCIRPDHGRHIWDEEGRPGYGLYDRALGIMYMLGIWDQKRKEQK
ncbi:mannonate dehydratase [Marinococcus halophilus]|uniref:mannonate dehydratase n=1 Tax=Marinococcus halophilus TaxID=1371 RepID=UPI0009A5BF6A|nr:mannonate dehydratase [Marinococcus halophilus]